MPQLIALALVGVGVYAGYKYVSKQLHHMADDAQRRAADDKRTATPQEIGQLEWDAAAGVCRPRRS